MRALLLIVEGLGVGVSPDQGWFQSDGTDTFARLRAGAADLELPALFSLGLGEIAAGRIFDPAARKATGCYGRMRPRSAASDPVSTHWELAGAVCEQPFARFDVPPEAFLAALATEAGTGFLFSCAEELDTALAIHGAEHLATGKPIILCGPGSRLRIAAHETALPLPRLHEISRIARRIADEWRIAQISTHPFTGPAGAWSASEGGHLYGMTPPRTVFNAISEIGLPVEAIGSGGGLLAQSGITRSHAAPSNPEVFRAIGTLWHAPQNGMILATLPDFNTLGRLDDPTPFARALERLDDWLANFLEEMDSDDLLIVTGNHGVDPSCPGPMREEVPVLLRYNGKIGPLGLRESFADVAATLNAFFHLPHLAGEALIPFHRAGDRFSCNAEQAGLSRERD